MMIKIKHKNVANGIGKCMNKRRTQLANLARIAKQRMIKLRVKVARYLCSKPRVHANMEAMLLVLVSCPFWCSRKCRVTVP